MNLNYNINNALLNRNRNFFLGKVGFEWSRTVSVAAGIQSGSIIFATGSIEYVPYAPTTLFVSGTYQAEQLGSGSALGLPVNIAITGSGVWAVTGSNDFSIVIGGNLGFNQSETLSLSAAAGNMNLSGSKISSSFNPEGNQEYNISFGVEHTKGNIYNPLVKFKTQNTSPVSTTELINGNTTASFNIVKDETIPLEFVKEVSASFNSQFNYEYNFGVTSSLTASIGNNITGSTTMSIEIPQAGVTKTEKYFNPTSEGTQIITASFAATTDTPYDITASVTYNKGNISTASINYQTYQDSTTQDLEGDATNLNGVSSSFELRKDATIQKAYIAEVSGSVKSGSYNNDYAFNQTASLTQNVNNTTGSVTMSIVVPEAGIDIEQRFFNPTTTQALLTASFTAQTIVGYNITASVVNNKGNEANSDINWKATGSVLNTSSSLSASFGIRKNANEGIINVNSVLISTASKFQNQYAFNITASLTGSYVPYFTADSSSFFFAKSRLEMPEIGIDIFSYGSASLLTGSFAAQTNVNEYNITGSIDEEATQLIEYTLIGGGGGGAPAQGQNPGAGGGAGALLTGSIKILPSETYTITIGKGGGGYTNGDESSLLGPLVPYDGTWGNNVESSSFFLIAPGGGTGGYGTDGGNPPSTGGSGGGGAGFGVDQLSQPPSAGTRPGALAVSASVLSNTMTASFIDINAAGAAGGAGVLLGRQSFPGFFYGAGGNGGGKPTNISWLNPIVNSVLGVAGGGGGGNQWAQGSYQTSGSFGGGNGQSIEGVVGNAVQFTGGGGGGASTYSGGSPISTPGYGASGSMSIRYPGYKKSLDGLITSASDGYTLHTFTSSADYTMYSKPFMPPIDYLIVAGGGGGAKMSANLSNSYAGGGGAGGLITGSLTLSASLAYPIVVGAGGLGAINSVDNLTVGQSGQSSSFLGITTIGGGYGGGNIFPAANIAGANGGSGGANGGLGTAGQGNDGVDGILGGGYNAGGAPLIWLDGINYAGGGGGFGLNNLNQQYGGATTATVGGGGNGRISAGGNGDNGQSGSVVIRYFNNEPLATGGLITSASGYIYHTFTSSADFRFDENKLTIL
jgi:hypothetical protein